MTKELAADRERQINIMLQQLSSSDPAERKEAALYLGEAAAGDSVDTLIEVYENDENGGVRKAAAYALGMFKAVEGELAKGNEAKVVKLLEKVENEGRLGKRANRSGLFSTVLLLVILAAILIGLNVFLPTYLMESDFRVTAGLITRTPDGRAIALPILRQTVTSAQSDLSALNTQYLSLRTGAPLNCTTFFNSPSPIQPATFTGMGELEAIGSDLNGIIIDLISAKGRFDNACSTGINPSETDITNALTIITNALSNLSNLEPRLTAIEAQVLPPTPRPATQTPLPSEATEESAVQLANPRAHLTALYGIIESATSPRGSLSDLQQRWTDVVRNGSTQCQAMPSNIASDYVLSEADANASVELKNAVELINQGLNLTRSGWTDFTLACNSQQLAASATNGLNNAQVALMAFQTATAYLDAVRDGG